MVVLTIRNSMKQQMTLRSILVSTCLLLVLGVQAQVVTIHVETPGTLSSCIAGNKKDLITNLTLTGNLNGTDICFIREMAGRDVHGDGTIGTLSTLDLSGANIVAGGNPYYGSYYSSKNAISERMFYGCPRLTSIKLPTSVTSIGNAAFWGCSSLSSITIPTNITSIGEGVFCGCYGLVEILVSESNNYYCSADGVLYSKDKSQLVSYPSLESTNYTIPNSVTSIAPWAFAYGRLVSVTIPASLTVIGSNAFYFCYALSSVTIPNTVSEIGSSAFFECSALTTFAFPSSATSISSRLFDGCSGLTSVTIPNSVTSIGSSAFSRCKALTSISLPTNITSIGDGAFGGCNGVSSFTIPNGITSINDNVFSGCSGLSSITIPNNIISIGNHAFSSCTGLSSVIIPNSVTSIGWSAFSNCTGLTTVDIPASVTSISTYAFCYCSALASVTIPNSVTSIGTYAFSYSGLKSIVIPESVISIREAAFLGCTYLEECHCKNARPLILESFVFEYVDKSTCKLFVPKGSYANYWVAPIWGDFASIIEEDLTSISKVQSDNIKVYTGEGAIIIEGVDPREIISVYAQSGALVQSLQATSDVVRIYVPVGNTYLIEVTGKSFKIAL